MNIQTESNNKRLLEALDHVDIRYVDELVGGLHLPKERRFSPSAKTPFGRSLRHVVLIAACTLLLGAVIPVVGTLVRNISSGMAAAGSDNNESEHYIEEELQNDAFDGSPNTEEAEASSEQSDSLEEQKVLNPLNVEALEKIPFEGALEALAAKAKAMVADSTTFEMDIPDRSNLRPQDYFFSLSHVLRYYYSVNTGDEYVSEKVNDAVRIDITAGKGNEENIRMAEYMTFLALLFKTYPDCVAFVDYKYDAAYNRVFFPFLMVCPDYAEYGYDTIYDYYEAVRSGKETRYEKAYHVSFASNHIRHWGSDSDENLFDELFKYTEFNKNETIDLTKVSVNVDAKKETIEILKDVAAASAEISLTDKKIVFDSQNDNNDYNSKYYALYHYINRNQTDSQIAGANELSMSSDKDKIEYLIFLSALLNDDSGAVAYYDINYDTMTTNRLYSPILVVCFEYKELGYDTVYELIEDASKEGKSELLEKVYMVSFDNEMIVSMSCIAELSPIKNQYDTIFNNTESK